ATTTAGSGRPHAAISPPARCWASCCKGARSRSTTSTARSTPPTTSAPTPMRDCRTAGSTRARSNARCTPAASTSRPARPPPRPASIRSRPTRSASSATRSRSSWRSRAAQRPGAPVVGFRRFRLGSEIVDGSGRQAVFEKEPAAQPAGPPAQQLCPEPLGRPEPVGQPRDARLAAVRVLPFVIQRLVRLLAGEDVLRGEVPPGLFRGKERFGRPPRDHAGRIEAAILVDAADRQRAAFEPDGTVAGERVGDPVPGAVEPLVELVMPPGKERTGAGQHAGGGVPPVGQLPGDFGQVGGAESGKNRGGA